MQFRSDDGKIINIDVRRSSLGNPVIKVDEKTTVVLTFDGMIRCYGSDKFRKVFYNDDRRKAPNQWVKRTDIMGKPLSKIKKKKQTTTPKKKTTRAKNKTIHEDNPNFLELI